MKPVKGNEMKTFDKPSPILNTIELVYATNILKGLVCSLVDKAAIEIVEDVITKLQNLKLEYEKLYEGAVKHEQ